MTTEMRALAASIALSLALTACGGDETMQPCTLIGCMQGLTVALTSPPNESFRVEAIAPGDPAVHRMDCPGGSCPSVTFANFQPDRVTISVITVSATTTYDKIPAYAVHFPNSPQCGPACRDGAVTVP
jgi:hypothetical protein